MGARFTGYFLLAMVVPVSFGFAQQDPADDSLRIYAVNILSRRRVGAHRRSCGRFCCSD
jgi:hypothetical protein